MATDNNNAGALHAIDFAPTTQMGKVGIFAAKERSSSTNPNSPYVYFSDQPVLAIPVVNRTGDVILRGRRCVFGAANEGPFKCVDALAGADQAGDGCAPWEIPSAGVPNGSTFNLIVGGPAKLAFDGVNVAIAAGDRIGAALSGLAAKWAVNGIYADSSLHTNTTDAADVQTRTIPANSLAAGQRFKITAAGTCPSTNSTDTLTLLFTFATQTVKSSGAIDVANDDGFFLTAECYVRSIGATGVILVSGVIALKTTNIPFSVALTVDTTAAMVVAINADWSAASTDDDFKVTMLEISHVTGSGLLLPFGRALEAVASDAADATLFKAMVDFRTMAA